MKVLVIIEHDNETVKQSSFSTITAAKEISDSVEAIVLGQGIDSVINELKKSDHLKKIYIVNKSQILQKLLAMILLRDQFMQVMLLQK